MQRLCGWDWRKILVLNRSNGKIIINKSKKNCKEDSAKNEIFEYFKLNGVKCLRQFV